MHLAVKNINEQITGNTIGCGIAELYCPKIVYISSDEGNNVSNKTYPGSDLSFGSSTAVLITWTINGYDRSHRNMPWQRYYTLW